MYPSKISNSNSSDFPVENNSNFVQRTVESEQSETPRGNITHCEFGDLVQLLFSRLISQDDGYFDIALNLSLACTKFYKMANYEISEFIKKQYNPTALFSAQISMLFCQERSQVPSCFTATYKQKAIELYCFALRNLNETPCKVYVRIYDQHVKTLLGLYEGFNFKKNKNLVSFSLFHLVQDGDDQGELIMNDYVFYQFLHDFFLSSKFIEFMNDASDLTAKKYRAIVKFLAKKKNLQNVKDLINLLIEQLSNNRLILEDDYLFGMRTLSGSSLIEKQIATNCISRLHRDLTDHETRDWRRSTILSILADFSFDDLLNSEDIKIFLFDIEEFIKKLSSEDVKGNAIELCGLLIYKKIIIEKEIVNNWIDLVIEILENNQSIKIQRSALYFLSLIIEEYLDFKTIENLIKRVLEFLTNDHETLGKEVREYACSFIQSFAGKGWEATENSLVLLNAFVKVLSGEENEIYEKIFELCTKLIQTHLIEDMDESMKKQLVEIAKKNLKSQNNVIRINAEKLYVLFEDKKLQLNRILQGILEKDETSEQSLQNLSVEVLSRFFYNLEDNAVGLREATLEFMAKYISELENKEKS